MMNNYVGKENLQIEERIPTDEGDFLSQLSQGIKNELEEISNKLLI